MKVSLILGLLLVSVPAGATTITVSVSGGGDYTAIAPAVAAAQDGDTILVSPGTYTGPDNRNIEFLGKLLVVRGADGDSLPLIDCEDQARAFNVHEGEPAGTSIERFAIANGNALELIGVSGGAITVVYSHCQIREVDIAGCTAASGGGICIYDGTASLSDVKMVDCTGLFDGGGLYVSSASAVTVQSTEIIGCSSLWGGGMRFGGDTLLVTDSVFKDNHCFEEGGGLFIQGAAVVELTDCVFEGNTSDELGGGLICWYGPSARLSNCVFRNNFAHLAGGGSCIKYIDDVLIEGCLFDGNETEGSGIGGGVCLRNIPIGRLLNCTITRCYAEPDRGAGIAVMMNANVAIDSCLVAFNRVGGGIGTFEYQSACTVQCSDVFGNQGGNYMGGMSDQTGIAGNISEDPQFCDLSDGDYYLATSSPCLPANNDCGALMGAYGEGCSTPTAVATGDTSGGEPRIPLLRVYPNPSRGQLWLDLSRFGRQEPCEGLLRVRIVDLSGRAVFDGAIDAAALAAGRAQLDLRTQGARLASGVYFGRFQDCHGQSHAFQFHLLK